MGHIGALAKAVIGSGKLTGVVPRKALGLCMVIPANPQSSVRAVQKGGAQRQSSQKLGGLKPSHIGLGGQAVASESPAPSFRGGRADQYTGSLVAETPFHGDAIRGDLLQAPAEFKSVRSFAGTLPRLRMEGDQEKMR